MAQRIKMDFRKQWEEIKDFWANMRKPLPSLLDELPVATGSLKCRNCGSEKWRRANTATDEHWLKADVVKCSDCTPANQLQGPQ
jgi:hypothetical protein